MLSKVDQIKLNNKQKKIKIISGNPGSMMGDEGDIVIAPTLNAGYVMYVRVKGKWLKMGQGLEPTEDGQGQLPVNVKPPIGDFAKIRLHEPPTQVNELGLLKNNRDNLD